LLPLQEKKSPSKSLIIKAFSHLSASRQFFKHARRLGGYLSVSLRTKDSSFTLKQLKYLVATVEITIQQAIPSILVCLYQIPE
jgi:hypothetical protein